MRRDFDEINHLFTQIQTRRKTRGPWPKSVKDAISRLLELGISENEVSKRSGLSQAGIRRIKLKAAVDMTPPMTSEHPSYQVMEVLPDAPRLILGLEIFGRRFELKGGRS
jgi:hypothetical protein